MNLNLIFKEKFLNSKLTKNKLFKNCKKIVEVISSEEGKKFGIINILFCDTKTIKRYNKLYLSHNYETDIITFEYKDNDKDLTDSDIMISVTTVMKNAGFYDTDFENELYRVVIHGILHLCGFKDKFKKDKVVMTDKEDCYIKRLKLNAR